MVVAGCGATKSTDDGQQFIWFNGLRQMNMKTGKQERASSSDYFGVGGHTERDCMYGCIREDLYAIIAT